MTTSRRSALVREWTAHGFDCVVLRMSLGHPCGYVRVPATHPWHGLHYSDEAPGREADLTDRTLQDQGLGAILAVLGGTDGVDRYARTVEGHIDIHGGVTYSGDLHDREGWWFGFDCAHHGDWSTFDQSGRKWPVEDVVRETERLAEQIAGAA